MNDFSNISAESEFRDEMTVSFEETVSPDAHLEAQYEERTEVEESPTEDAGWPGDGSGMDDLADYNANEAMDYMGE